MRDTLPNHVWENEAGIVNFDSVYGNETQWVCYVKRKNKVKYFNSFGNLNRLLN